MSANRKTGKITYEGMSYYVHAPASELDQAKADKLAELKLGHVNINRSMSVKDWGKVWYTKYRKAANASEANNRDYKTRLYNFVYPSIGHRQIHTIIEADLQDILNGMARDGKSKDRIEKVKQCMAQLFQKADANGLLNRDPAAHLIIPKSENGKGRELTPDERRALMIYAPGLPDALIFEVMLFCGIRPGETRRLRFKDINKESGYLYVDGTKNSSAKRYVPCPPFLIDRLMLSCAGKKRDDYIFVNELGNQLTGKNIVRRWKALMTAINIGKGCKVYRNELQDKWTADDLVPYCCRHTFNNDMKYSAIPFAILEEIMGHSLGGAAASYSHNRIEGVISAEKALNKYWMEKKIINPYTGDLFSDDEYYGRKIDLPENVIKIDFSQKEG